MKLLVTLLCCASAALGQKSGLQVTYDGKAYSYSAWDGPVHIFGKDVAAQGTFNDTLTDNGWTFFSVYGNPAFDDQIVAYAAGYIEGFLTHTRMWQTAVNTGLSRAAPSPQLRSFMSTHDVWAASMINITSSLAETDTERQYFYHLSLITTQIKGMYDGYTEASPFSESLTPFQVELLTDSATLEQVQGLLGDGEFSLNNPNLKKGNVGLFMQSQENGRCSALLRLLDNNEDIFISQITWTEVNQLIRTYKLYDLPYTVAGPGTARVPGWRVTMSSYPGSLYSGDDFYLTSAGLVAQETTIGNSNPELWKLHLSPLTVWESFRTIIALRLAGSAPAWTDWFARYNSGTYNNEFMVFDYKLFTPGQTLPKYTFMLLDQTPGYVRVADLSSYLQEERYFASYNIPFFQDVAEFTGVDDLVKQYGNIFSWYNTSRARIFRKLQSNIYSMADMEYVMRYDDFTHDPDSSYLDTCEYMGWRNCTPGFSAELVIATRGDLNRASGIYPLPLFGQRNHAAIDGKITSFRTFDPYTLPARIVSSPPFQTNPPFQWSTSPYNSTSHLGMPDKWDFDWLTMSWA